MNDVQRISQINREIEQLEEQKLDYVRLIAFCESMPIYVFPDIKASILGDISRYRKNINNLSADIAQLEAMKQDNSLFL